MQGRPLPSRHALFALFLAFTLVWVGGLGFRKLAGPDEGRYAEIAREMLVSGDFVTPRLDGLKYFEKPPLQYWASAAALAAFGQSEWAARLWAGTTGFLCVLLTYFTGCRLFGRKAGLLAAAVLGSSLLFLLVGHMNTLDMGLAFFLNLAVAGVLLANREPEQARRWMLTTWTALALAVLSKGLVALLLPLATLLAYSLLTRDFAPWRRLHLAIGLPLLLLLTAPWHLAVSLANPDFFHFYFIHEHFERFLTTVHGRYQPWWYFLPILAAGALPWTTVMAQALATAWRSTDAALAARRLLLVWSAVVLGFFSASGSKLPPYILPMFPALALLAGDWLARAQRRTLLIHLGLATLAAVAALLLTTRVPGLAGKEFEKLPMASYALTLGSATGLWFAGGVLALALVWRERIVAAILALAASALAAGLCALIGHDVFSPLGSGYHLARQLPYRPEIPFYSIHMYDQTLPFYLGRTLTLVEFRGELAFGLDAEPERGLATVARFVERWRQDGQAYAVMPDTTYAELAREQLPMVVVARDPQRVVVAKP